PVSNGDADVFLHIADPEALKTWAGACLRSEPSWGRAVVLLVRSLAAHLTRLPRVWSTRLHAAQPLGPGTVVLLRSQKLIVLDRFSGLAYQLLRDDHSADVDLLRNEVLASTVVPDHSVPTLFH